MVVRTKSLADLRRSEGRDLSDPKKQRIEHWLSKGAKMSPTVNNLLVEKGIVKGDKIKVTRTKKKKEEK